jgi:preprotein translocase subunit YajC
LIAGENVRPWAGGRSVVEDHVHAFLSEYSMQPEATSGSQTGSTSSSQGTPSHEGQSSPGLGFEMQLPILALMFGLFYFLMIRPQQKRQREADELLKALKRGDVVRTSGGIRGEITDLADADVTLLIADKTKINILRSHIASKVTSEAVKEKA